MTRKNLSKSTRFEVFKRDGFACQYCGAHPPKAILEVDHIQPVAHGGDDAMDNLITACFDCNRGKSARLLENIPQSLADRAEIIAEREAQILGYSAVMAAARDRIESQVWMVFNHWRAQERTSHERFQSVKMFVEKIGVYEVIEAVDIAMGAGLSDFREWKFFCGVCWNKVRESGE